MSALSILSALYVPMLLSVTRNAVPPIELQMPPGIVLVSAPVAPKQSVPGTVMVPAVGVPITVIGVVTTVLPQLFVTV